MLPLDIRFSRSVGSRTGSFAHRFSQTLTACALFSGLAACPLHAQDKADDPNAPKTVAPAPVQPPPPIPINFRERPRYPTDAPRLRRTPRIDGVLSDGEWDPFYTITDGPTKGTIYCNWDDDFLYVAARSEQPAALLLDLDMGGDGWLRSADNLELLISFDADNATPHVAARLLDAANSKDTPSWNEKAVDAKTIAVAAKVTNGTQIIELAIPKNTASLVLRPGVNLGLRAEFLPREQGNTFTPTQPFEPHLLLDATLVESRAQAASGINPRLTLSDYKCIATQTLFATLDLLNQTDTAMPIKSVTWAGQGTSVNAVNTLREVTVPPIPAQKNLKLKYKSQLPPGLAPGSYTLTATVELQDGKQVQSTSTFTVVEPVQAQMSAEPQPVTIIGPTKLQILVDVFSAVPDHFQGDVELTNFPSGWELQGGKKRSLHIDREDARRIMRYTFKVPSTTPAGDYPFAATVTWHGREWKLQYTLHADHPETPAPKKP